MEGIWQSIGHERHLGVYERHFGVHGRLLLVYVRHFRVLIYMRKKVYILCREENKYNTLIMSHLIVADGVIL